MPFSRKYLLWLIVPPALITLPPALAFLSQVVQVTTGVAVGLMAMLTVMYGAGCVLFVNIVGPKARAVETAVSQSSNISRAASDCLQTTSRTSAAMWGGGGLLFAIIGTFVAMRSFLGFAYFIAAALIAVFPSVVWGYAMGKHQLTKFIASSNARTQLHYVGAPVPLGRKIAIIFIGAFLLSAVTLVLLVSSKVATTLEELAIKSSSDRFDRLYESANTLDHVDGATLDKLRSDLPNEYALHHIKADGTAQNTKDPLTADEIAHIRRLGTGDSSAYVGPHVTRFRELKDGSILALSVPWEPYRDIPFQITFYTLVITILTTLMFIAATWFLARDVVTPLHELRGLAKQMAEGKFEAEARVFSDDEVGQLADSFGDTRANLRRLLGRVGGSGATITDGVRVITGGTESLLLRSRDQADIIESSSMAVENVRGGISSVLGAADTVSELTHDASSRSLELQASSEEVARSMDYLFQSVEKTSSSTTEMNASMVEMSNRTNVLAGIGDEVLSFVSEMDSTIAELRSSSHATAEIAQRVREEAEAGGAAVHRTVEGINASQELTNSTAEVLDELQRSVGQISQILTVIEEVANRTNLLSLNAAIIAAQAGEHGAGFTVVADEIRLLAERTRGSTKEISTIIKAVQGGSRTAVLKMHEGIVRVQQNVDLANEATTSLRRIVDSSTNSYEMATKISRALEDQASASRHLHEVTSRMSDHIAEINRATREQARGTELLAQESERVRDIAAQVRNATDEQSAAGRGITTALERIAEDAKAMRDLLERQLEETDRIADASRVMLEIAQKNDAIAHDFNTTVQNLVSSGQAFESEVARFRYSGSDH